jgi:hypothetical protein
MLHMRSFVRADVVLDAVEQPPLLNFSWQQLGRDKPIQAMIDGFNVAGIERDLAIFPDTSGRLIIEPFTRHVTIVNSDGQRVEASFSSKSIYFDVQNYSAISPPDAWWLPASAVSVTESWSQVPDEIKPGTLARRTIKVEAVGLTGDRLPPPPPMLAPGTIAFRGPVERETVITEDGPIARGTYVWDLRPVSASPAQLPAVNIRWFDTQARHMRDSALPAVWVALVGTLVHPSHEVQHIVGPLSPGPLAAGLTGFVWTAALLGFAFLPRARPPSRRVLASRRALRALGRSARGGNAADFSTELNRLARTDAARWQAVAAMPEVSSRLAGFDRARFGRGNDALPPLPPIAEAVRRAWRAAPAGGPKPG